MPCQCQLGAQRLLDECRQDYADLADTVDNPPAFDDLARRLPRAFRKTKIEQVNARGGRQDNEDQGLVEAAPMIGQTTTLLYALFHWGAPWERVRSATNAKTSGPDPQTARASTPPSLETVNLTTPQNAMSFSADC
jgi:hypothetical protein